MSRTYIIGAGHGGMIDGIYQTSGKRSPKPLRSTGEFLFEGVNNRDNARRLVEELEKNGIKAVNLIDTEKDVFLNVRSNMVNNLARGEKCVYIDLHSDGFGTGKDWHTAHGFTVFHYTHASRDSIKIAKSVSKNLGIRLDGSMRNRGVKSANFHALRTTNCPAILLELGFHTNESVAEYILTEEFKTKAIRGIVDGIVDFENNLVS